MSKNFMFPKSLKNTITSYCPGCGHGVVHRILAEVIDELDLRERTIGIAPVGCAVFAYNYWNFDVTEAAHGRPPAVATGLKRVLKDKVIFTYQGDGDLAAIGTAEIVHAANRGENITVIFINNAIYGMTNGQMAPTSLVGQKTQTTPLGRDIELTGYPMKVSEMLSTLEGVKYLERTAITTPNMIKKTKEAITKAFKCQLENKGFSMVEVLATCPTNWKMDPVTSVKWIQENMEKIYPLKVFKS